MTSTEALQQHVLQPYLNYIQAYSKWRLWINNRKWSKKEKSQGWNFQRVWAVLLTVCHWRVWYQCRWTSQMDWNQSWITRPAQSTCMWWRVQQEFLSFTKCTTEKYSSSSSFKTAEFRPNRISRAFFCTTGEISIPRSFNLLQWWKANYLWYPRIS